MCLIAACKVRAYPALFHNTTRASPARRGTLTCILLTSAILEECWSEPVTFPDRTKSSATRTDWAGRVPSTVDAVAPRSMEGASDAEEGRATYCGQTSKPQVSLVVQPDGYGVACAVRLPSVMQQQGPDGEGGRSKGSSC